MGSRVPPNSPGYYRILGLRQSATPDAIRRAYRAQVRQWHPDRVSDPAEKAMAHERMIRIQEAYEVLSHPERRAAYDAWLERARQAMAQGAGGPGFADSEPPPRLLTWREVLFPDVFVLRYEPRVWLWPLSAALAFVARETHVYPRSWAQSLAVVLVDILGILFLPLTFWDRQPRHHLALQGIALALLALLKALAWAAVRWHWPAAEAASPDPFSAWLGLSAALLLARASLAVARWSVWAVHRTEFLD